MIPRCHKIPSGPIAIPITNADIQLAVMSVHRVPTFAVALPCTWLGVGNCGVQSLAGSGAFDRQGVTNRATHTAHVRRSIGRGSKRERERGREASRCACELRAVHAACLSPMSAGAPDAHRGTRRHRPELFHNIPAVHLCHRGWRHWLARQTHQRRQAPRPRARFDGSRRSPERGSSLCVPVFAAHTHTHTSVCPCDSQVACGHAAGRCT